MTFTSPFTGNVIQPTDVSYAAVTLETVTQLYWPQYVNAGQQVVARIMDVDATGTGAILTLPNALQGSVGSDILIRNIGSEEFAVQNYDEVNSFFVPAGQAVYTYLSDNTTTGGVWENIAFGAGVAYADAATLAGNSTAAILGRLETAFVTSSYLTAPTITDNTRGHCLVWTSGAGTWTLPAVSSLSAGWFILVRNNGTGALTIQTSAVNSTIDDQGSITLPLGDSCFICVNRDITKQDFFTVGRARPNSLTFSSATYDVDTVSGATLSLITNTPIIQRFTALSGSRTTSLLVQLPAVTQVYYFLNDTNQSSYNINFQVQGSSQVPYSLAASRQAIVLSDGNNIYPLLQANVGQFLANRGTAAAPAFSFNLDPTSGMYSPNDAQLGFSVGGTNIATMDGTAGPGNFVTTFVGQVRAGLISGGTF
ncbi:hypothetical protein UFOVP229_81 [uncultured Caudovirales phage]|uniref:Uncharacterized protein n=1 Tax=uncultured Caudovirales phage TaxID=2100421 RepID=A0A6J7WP00_9CAUD|nr:hypothetical protein UFOVP229_81 [uncultured Caudovirales phage]